MRSTSRAGILRWLVTPMTRGVRVVSPAFALMRVLLFGETQSGAPSFVIDDRAAVTLFSGIGARGRRAVLLVVISHHDGVAIRHRAGIVVRDGDFRIADARRAKWRIGQAAQGAEGERLIGRTLPCDRLITPVYIMDSGIDGDGWIG